MSVTVVAAIFAGAMTVINAIIGYLAARDKLQYDNMTTELGYTIAKLQMELAECQKHRQEQREELAQLRDQREHDVAEWRSENRELREMIRESWTSPDGDLKDTNHGDDKHADGDVRPAGGDAGQPGV